MNGNHVNANYIDLDYSEVNSFVVNQKTVFRWRGVTVERAYTIPTCLERAKDYYYIDLWRIRQ